MAHEKPSRVMIIQNRSRIIREINYIKSINLILGNTMMEEFQNDHSVHLYLVAFKVEDQFRPKLIDAIKASGDWAALTATTLLVQTKCGQRDMMEKLQPMLGPLDSLWIFIPAAQWVGYGPAEVEDWIGSQLGPEQDFIPKDWDDDLNCRK